NDRCGASKSECGEGYGEKKAELQAHINKAQAELSAKTEAEKAVKELFVSNNPANTIKETVTQATIDAAQAKVNAVKDTAKKAELQAHINKAQAEFDAKIEEANAKTEAEKAVKELFVSNNPANTIKETVTQATIDAAQAKVNAVKDTAKKAELQAHINKAQAELDAKTEATEIDKANQFLANYLVNQLYQNDEPLTDAIKATTNQGSINLVQAQIDKLLPSAVKTGLQNKLNRAQELLNIRTAVEAGIQRAVKALFEDSNPANTIKETVTQADIDAVQARVDTVTDPATKAELQAYIDKAQAEFDAKKETEAADKGQQAIAGFLVNQLYQDNNPATDAIKATTNQAAIDEAQAQIDLLLPSAVKTDLQNKLNRAQELLNAKNTAEKAVNELFEGNKPANKIKETVTQADIDAAQAKVDKVTDSAKKAELQAHIDKAQAEFDVKKEAEAADKEQQLIAGFLVDQLYQNNNPATDAIKATTNQAAIDEAQAQIDLLLPSAVKTDLQNKLNRAQELLNAKNTAEKAVNELFEGNKPANKIKETVTQADIDAAQAKVDALTDPAKKAELQAHIDKAQVAFDAKKEAEVVAEKAVNELFEGNNPANKVKETVKQTDIDAAQEKVNAITDPAKKAELQAHVDKAQAEFDATHAVIVAPKVQTVSNKDTVVTGTGTPGYTAVVTIGGKTYTGMVGANGSFAVTIPAQKADTIITVAQKNGQKTGPATTVKVVNYIPAVAPIIDNVAVFQQAITGKVPAGTLSVRLIVNGVPQRLVAPDAEGNFSFYSRFISDGTVSNLRLKEGDVITVDYGNRTPAHLVATTTVGTATKPVLDTVYEAADYVSGLVPTGTQVIRLSINGVPQRTVTPQAKYRC
ncbi:toxin Cry1Ac domain D-VI-related protein, partial [Listeria rocourtiae]|uniref:toxin Cry1Ac domain D-VI-related protein n=1 Tax=Listeria rocourtiae TaxID=647910 RepID=UPI0003E889BF